ncbi:MAG: NADH-quinone oxidoreductase subunit K [Spirochaetales bacterium]|nr:NADH-quinone oxidoreductase subunit K [Spirochaetales bacterium]
MVFTLCFAVFVIGLYCALTKKNIIKIVIGLTLMEYSVNLFLVMLGYRKDGIAPIRTRGIIDFLERAVDPLPQALVLTSIVIGLGVTAMAIAICIRLYQRYGTFDIMEIRRLKG